MTYRGGPCYVSRDRANGVSELTRQSAILDSLSAHIAVLDSAGTIVSVNLSWRKFADENGLDDTSAGVGCNYLEVCRSADPDPNALKALDGIEAVMDGRLSSFYLKYPCHGTRELRWFALRASPLLEHANYVVVSHEDITGQVLARIRPRPRR